MDIYALDFNYRLNANTLRLLNQFLDSTESERFERFVNWQDSHRALYGKLLLLYLVHLRTGMDVKGIEFQRNSFGKPFLEKENDQFFNLSHAGKWVVASLDNRPIGIDIEKIRPVEMDIARRFFSKSEYRALMAQPEAGRQAYFFRLWTLKESYIKMVGRGLSIPLDSFTIHIDNDQITLHENRKPAANVFFKMYHVDHGFSLSVCANNRNFPPTVNKMRETEIQDFFLSKR